MGVLLTVILVILAVLIVILSLKLSVKFSLSTGDKEKLKLRIFAYSEKIGFDIKFKDKNNDENKDENKDEKTESKDEKKDAKSIFEKLLDLYKELQKVKYTCITSKDFIKKRLVLKELNVLIEFGLSDAAKTGIATGAVWATIYNVLEFLTKFVTLKNHKFNVEPDYNNEKYYASFDGIITVRIVNIISIALYVLMKYMKISKEYE